MINNENTNQSNNYENNMAAQEINSNDVLCGRGGLTNSHVGNKRFRDVVSEYQMEYLKSRKNDKKGIARFAYSYVTFDETLTRTAMDLCNRPYFIWNVKTTLDKVGDMDQELFSEFFKSLITEARMNCHIETLYGDNNHHIIESCFKSFALSLKKAVTIDPRKKNIPSSKGKL